MTRLRRPIVAIPALAVTLVLLGLVLWVRAGANVHFAESTYVLMCVLFIVVGEMVRVRASDRQVAPVSTASILGLVLAPVGTAGLGLGFVECLVSIGLAAAVGVLLREVVGLAPHTLDVGARVIGGVVTAGITRLDFGGGNLLSWAYADGRPAWLGATGLAVAAMVGVTVELGVWTATRGRTWRIPLLALAREDVSRSGSLALIMITAGPLMGISVPVLGAWAVPLFLWPIALALIGLRRAHRVATMEAQLVQALARITDETGHTVKGHARRVSRLSSDIARELGLGPAELRVVRDAALLHDIGQVTLATPIPDGATTFAAPAEQAAVVRASVSVAQSAGTSASVLEAIRGTQVQFRQLRELGEPIPVAGRIIKVANAYDDLSGGRRTLRGPALERIHLGLGYEYDPVVVDALTRITETGHRDP